MWAAKWSQTYSLWVLLLIAACANPVPPDGGIKTRKDTEPPKVLEQEPGFASTNFQTDRIRIDFDEYVVLQDVFNQVLVSPPMSERPDLSLRKKSLIVKLPDDLRENTTYTINFGEAIKDYHEGNVLQNLNYVFSTGPELDSGLVKGVVLDGQTESAPEKAIVALYLADSFDAVTRKKPYYFAFASKDGSYSIPFIAPGSYYLFAYTDENFNYYYDLPGNEKVAFLNDEIKVEENSSMQRDLLLFEEMAKPQLMESKFIKPGLISFAFNRPISTLLLNSSRYQQGDFVEVSPAKDTFYYWSVNADTGRATFALTINKEINDTVSVRYKSAPKPWLEIENLIGKDSIAKTGQHSAVLKFSAPLDSIREDLIQLYGKDSAEIEYAIEKPGPLELELNWPKSQEAWELRLEEKALSSIYGQSSKGRIMQIIEPVGKLSGDLLINYETIPSSVFPVLELVNSKNKVMATVSIYSLSGTPTRIEDVVEGVYSIRVFNDADKNGIWSTGILEAASQPEEYIYRKSNVSVKGAWETEIAIEW